MIRKWLLICLSVVMVAGVLVACSNNSGTNVSDNSSSANSGTSTSNNEANDEADPVTIKFMYWTDSASEAMYQEVADAFMVENPNINVDLIDSDGGTYDEKLTVMLTGSGEVDAFAIMNPVSYYQFASTNRIPSISDRVEQNIDQLAGVKGLLDTLKIDGELYGIPFRQDIWTLYYNKELFDNANEPYPTDDMTWEEYSEIAKRMTQGEGQDKIWGSFSPDWPQSWYMYAHQTGETYFDEELDTFLDGLKWRLDLVESKANPTIAENKATNAHYRTAFLSGRYAMVYVGTWFAGMLNQDFKDGKLNFEWDMAAIPHPEGVPAGTTLTDATVHALSPKTEYADEAFKFISYISSEAGQQIVAKYQTPASSSESVKAVYENAFENPINLNPLFDAIMVAEKPMGPGMPQIETILTEEGELALLGLQTPEEAIEKIKERRAAVLKDAK